MSFKNIAKIGQYFKNKPKAEILKRIQFCVLRIREYNTVLFLT